MDSNYRAYNYLSSFARIDEVLALPAGSFAERKMLPDRDELTYTNGFYAQCSALFVDIRGSSTLPDHYQRPTLAKIYRAFISETAAILNSHSSAREINIVGDCVWAVFNTPYKSDIDDVYTLACTTNSMIKALNCKMRKRNYRTPIRVGIGMSYGRALMIKAGYSGSGIADVVYMGDVVNQASKLATNGSSSITSEPMVMDADFYGNLNKENRGFVQYDQYVGAYTSSAVMLVMEEWYQANCP